MIKPKNFLLIIFVLLSFAYSAAMETPEPFPGGTAQESAKKSIVEILLRTITQENVQAGIKQYHDLKSNYPDSYNFDEYQLNTVGYRLLRSGKIKDAIEIFKLNVKVFPDAFNPYDSLGEGYMEDGQKELAIKNYKKSVELNPDNEVGFRYAFLLEHYSKKEYMVPVRDGVRLFTQVYAPLDTSQKYPSLWSKCLQEFLGAIVVFCGGRVHICFPGLPREVPIRRRICGDVAPQKHQAHSSRCGRQ